MGDERGPTRRPIPTREWVKGAVFVALAIVILFALFWLTSGPKAI